MLGMNLIFVHAANVYGRQAQLEKDETMSAIVQSPYHPQGIPKQK